MARSPSSTSVQVIRWVAILGVVVGLVLAVVSLLGRGDLIHTEIISYELARHGPQRLYERLTFVQDSPATLRYHGGLLYHVLLWGWLQLGSSDLALRAFTLVAGLASLVLLWRAGRELGTHTGLVLVALCLTSPMLLDWFTSARPYGLFFLLSCASSLSLLALVEDGRRRWILAWLVSSTALAYTHHFTLHLLAAQAVFALLAAWRGWLGRRQVSTLAGAAGLLALALLPLVGMLRLHLLTRGVHLDGWSVAASARALLSMVGGVLLRFDHVEPSMLGGLGLVSNVATVGLLVAGAVVTWQRSRPLAAFLAAVLVVPLCAEALVVGVSGRGIEGMRYFIYMVPVLQLPVVLLVDQLARGRHALLAPAVLVLALAMSVGASAVGFRTLTWTHYRDARHEARATDPQPWRMETDWRSLSQHLAPGGPPVVVVDHIKDALYLSRYLRADATVVCLDKPLHDHEIRDGLGSLACIGQDLWYVQGTLASDHPMRPDLPGLSPEEVHPAGVALATSWRPEPQTCARVQPVPPVTGAMDEEHTWSFTTTQAGWWRLPLMVRLVDAPPYAGEVEVDLDGSRLLMLPVGVNCSLMRSVRVELPAGSHTLRYRFRPMAPNRRDRGSRPSSPR